MVKKIFLLMFFAIFLISFASALTYVQNNHGENVDASLQHSAAGGGDTPAGLKITLRWNNISNFIVQKGSNTNSTTCGLWFENQSTSIVNGTFSGNNCSLTAPYNIPTGIYWFQIGVAGADRFVLYRSGTASFNYTFSSMYMNASTSDFWTTPITTVISGIQAIWVGYETTYQPTVTLNLPLNATNGLTANYTFNATVAPDTFSLTNSTLYLWFDNGTLAKTQTNTSFTGNYSIINETLSIPSTYYWNIYGVQGNGNGTNSSFATTNNTITISQMTEDSQNYDSSPLENTITTFVMNGTLGSSYSLSAAYLNWNGSNYSASFSAINSSTYKFTRTQNLPTVSANTNITFFWYVVFTDGSMFNSSGNNQTIINFGIDNCSSNTIQIMNLTLRDEDNQTLINGTTQNSSIKVDLILYPYSNLSGTAITYSSFYNQTNPARVCVSNSLGSSEYYMNAQIQYASNEHAVEYYNIQNYSLNASVNPSENITLYDLLDSSSQSFVINYKNSNYLGVADALIQVSRKYVDEGAFKTVEIPITDNSGSTIANLRLNDAIYTFTVTKYGKVLGIFSNYLANCQNPTIQTCEINLNAFQSSLSPSNFSSNNDFLYVLSYNNNTRVITATFSIPSGAVSDIFLNITKDDALGTSTCNQSVTTSSGSLQCTISSTFGNGTVVVKLYKDTILVGTGRINLQQTPSQIFGNSLVFLSILMMITLIGVAISDNPVIMIVSLMIGVILLFSLNLVAHNGLIGSGATILFLIFAIIIILIKIARRS